MDEGLSLVVLIPLSVSTLLMKMESRKLLMMLWMDMLVLLLR